MSEQPEVTFIICTYNRAAYLEESLQSLLRESHTARFEILVVDNNSTDSTPQVADRYAKDDNPVRYIKEPNQGLSHARNRGIKEAQASCLVFLDDDIRAGKKLISAWAEFFADHPDVMAAGGRIHVQFDDPRPEWMSHFLLPLLGHHDLGTRPKLYPSNKYPFGGNMGFRKELFERLGNFHTDLGRKGKQLKASEEKELFRRLRAENIQIHYLPKAMLFHRVNKQRLTEEYIRRQAIGLGQSIALQVEEDPRQKVKQWTLQLSKFAATAGLSLPYTLSFQPSKALMLFKFRKWIAEGYFSHNTSV